MADKIEIKRGVWERQTGQYQWGESYRIGKVVVGRAQHVSGSRDEPPKFGAYYDLPGIKTPDDRYTNVEDAKARVERGVATWFKWLGEKP